MQELFMCILYLLLPCVYDGSLAESAETSKTFFLLFWLLLLFVLNSCSRLANTSRFKFSISRIDICLLVLLGYTLCNRYLIDDHNGFSIRFIELVGLSFLYIFLRFTTLKMFLFIFISIILSGVVLSVYGILQLYGFLPSRSFFKVTGGFGNPGPYAGYLAITICLSLALYLYKERIVVTFCDGLSKNHSRVSRTISNVIFFTSTIAIALGIIVLPVTLSVAAWFSVIAGGSYLIIQKNKTGILHFMHKRSKRVRSLIKLSLVFFGGMMIFAGFVGYRLKEGSYGGRQLIWKVTGTMIKDNPVFGVGYDRFKTYYMNAQAKYFEYNENKQREALLADNTCYAFNELLQLLAENGIVSLVICVILLFVCTNVYVRADKAYVRNLVIGAGLPIFIFSMVSYPMQVLPIKLVLVTLVALLSRLDIKKRIFTAVPENIPYKKLVTGVKSVVFFICILLAGILFNQTHRLKLAYKDWQQALNMYEKGVYKESVLIFEIPYAALKENGEFLMTYGKALAMTGENGKAKDILENAKVYLNNTVIETTLGNVYENLKEYPKAEWAYLQASRMVPNRFYPEYLLAKLYYATGREEKGDAKAKEILEKQVKLPSIAITEMQLEMRRKLNSKNIPP